MTIPAPVLLFFLDPSVPMTRVLCCLLARAMMDLMAFMCSSLLSLGGGRVMEMRGWEERGGSQGAVRMGFRDGEAVALDN